MAGAQESAQSDAYAAQLAATIHSSNSNNSNNNDPSQHNFTGPSPNNNTTLHLDNANSNTSSRPLILITDSNSARSTHDELQSRGGQKYQQQQVQVNVANQQQQQQLDRDENSELEDEGEQVEIIDGIKYRIVAAVTKPHTGSSKLNQRRGLSSTANSNTSQYKNSNHQNNNNNNNNHTNSSQVILEQENENSEPTETDGSQLGATSSASNKLGHHQHSSNASRRPFNSLRRKSSAFVSNLLQNSFLGPQSASNHDICGGGDSNKIKPRRLSIYEMTKSPPPETSLEIYLSERRRSSTISSKQAQQQLEQQSTFETNYCQRQQYFKDLNQKLINHDKKLLNVVANRGQIHRHSVDIAQLPLHLAQAKASKANKLATAAAAAAEASKSAAKPETAEGGADCDGDGDGAEQRPGGQSGPSGTLSGPRSRLAGGGGDQNHRNRAGLVVPNASAKSGRLMPDAINQSLSSNAESDEDEQQQQHLRQQRRQVKEMMGQQDTSGGGSSSSRRLIRSSVHRSSILDKRGSIASSLRGAYPGSGLGGGGGKKSRIVIRKFQKLDLSQLSSTPAPEVKIGQRVAYKEYYGNEFGTIRWIGRVPQICPDWTAGVEFDNAIGEGDGSLNGRRYFIAKDCFAKFLPLNEVAFVDQHVGRPEPGTMISVMSAAVRPGQMISIQRVSTVHVQHCFLNAPHQIPGADILAVNSRLHCQCPNCGPCAHVIKPPRTQRLARSKKNATHMCQFSTYTCCGMESQEEAMCTYTGNRAGSSLPPPILSSSTPMLPPPAMGNSWIEGSGYLTQLQAQQSKMMPDEYKMGVAPEDATDGGQPHDAPSRRHLNRSSSSRRASGNKHHHHHHHQKHRHKHGDYRGPEDQSAQQDTTYTDETAPQPTSIDMDGGWQSSALRLDDRQTLWPKSLNETTNINKNVDPTDQYLPQIGAGDIMQDPPSYSPNPDYANFNFNNNNNNTTSQKPYSSGGTIYPKKNTNNTPYVEPVWCESSSTPPPPPKLTPKSAAKVVYRDSIENRYLFPTDDDPIDSTLEADLENLSQARYGHSTSNTNTNLRLNGSKNIFKSLRSLVSCLSATNHSEIMERRSENTMKFSEFGDRTGTTSKAVPVLFNANKQPLNDLFVHSINHHQKSFRSEEKENLIQQQQHQVNINNYNNNNFIRSNQQNMAQNNNNNVTSDDQTTTIMRQISSSSDCGFSSASQNSINFQAYQTNNISAASPQISPEEERKRLQIYNNFLAHLISSTTMNGDDLNRLRRVLFELPPRPQVDNCCLHGGSGHQVRSMAQGAFSGEAEQILLNNGDKKSAYLFHDEKMGVGLKQVQRPSSACYHTAANYYPPPSATLNDLTSKSLSSGCHGDRLRRKSPNGGEDYLNPSYHESSSNHVAKRKSLIDGASTTSESATLSSYDSFSGTAVICGDSQSISSKDPYGKGNTKSRNMESDKSQTNSTSSALPKAFELKLTLSINNSEKISQDQSLSSKEAMPFKPDATSTMPDGITTANGNLLNSTFNINIISQKGKDDETPIAEGLIGGDDISSGAADCQI